MASSDLNEEMWRTITGLGVFLSGAPAWFMRLRGDESSSAYLSSFMFKWCCVMTGLASTAYNRTKLHR